MSPAAITLGAATARAVSPTADGVRADWVPGELLLRRAVRTVNEDLAIVGLRLRLDPAHREAGCVARHFVRCVGECAPAGDAHAVVTIRARRFSAQFVGVSRPRAEQVPQSAPASLPALCDFLLAIAESLACPAGGATASASV